MKVIEQRVAKLEKDVPEGGRSFVWANVGETANEAIAREFPDGVAATREVTVFRFSEPPNEAA